MGTVMAGTLAWIPKGQSQDYFLKSQGVDTVLEIRLTHPALKGEGIINPPLAFSTEVRASLTRVGEREPLHWVSMKYRSTERKFAEWAKNDARPLHEELQRCYQTVAAKIVEQLGVPAWPQERPLELAADR